MRTDGPGNIWDLYAFSLNFMRHFPHKSVKITTLTSRFMGFPPFSN
jgi:hypothetical protein